MGSIMKGRLKIYFSYEESIGKTYTMLKAAHEAKEKGIDVVVGHIAHRDLEKISALLDGLEVLEPKFSKNGEFNLDQALKRRPALILVDELAYTNGKGCRHRKRYLEIWELLNAGIDVYTTVNVGNLESLQDTVASITGIRTMERIPDTVFDQADQVELIDIEPQDLIRRMQETETDPPQISLEKLTALREIALRRCADRVKRLSERQKSGGFQTSEHILACLSSAPSNAKIIRTAARMAGAFNSQFTALFVETPDFAVASEENKSRLRENSRLAEALGAEIETVYGEDIPYQIAEYARVSGITKIVLGRSSVTRKYLFWKPTLTEQLLSYAPEIDIHIIPDQSADVAYRPKKMPKNTGVSIFYNATKSTVILIAATLLGFFFEQLGFTDANIIMVYILGVLATSIATSHWIYSLISSFASVLIFNYLFTTPRFSFTAYETGYPVTFMIMFLTAFVTGTFAIRYREQANQSAKLAFRTKVLFDTDKMLSRAKGKEEILMATAEQITKLVNRNIVVYEAERGKLSAPRLFPCCMSVVQAYDLKKEKHVAEWVYKNRHAAGATTDTLSEAGYLYFSLRLNEHVYGVVGIEVCEGELDATEQGILKSILGECALALENEKNLREKEAAAVLAENEQLRANILRTISHDLRTPLTTISGNASTLLYNGRHFDERTRQKLYEDIYTDSIWLISLVENLLSATRIEEGRLNLNRNVEMLSDIVDEAVRHVSRNGSSHIIETKYEEELVLVKVDARLVVQVIVNIVDNAMKYTDIGSTIVITVGTNGRTAEVKVSDNGCGISDQDKERIFNKFYCGQNKIADNRRRLGLGLYLCKAIIEAHGGIIQVSDNKPRGSIFSFTLPLEEVTLHE